MKEWTSEASGSEGVNEGRKLQFMKEWSNQGKQWAIESMKEMNEWSFKQWTNGTMEQWASEGTKEWSNESEAIKESNVEMDEWRLVQLGNF